MIMMEGRFSMKGILVNKKDLYFPKCRSEMPVNSGNSDANCHRKRYCYSVKLLRENPDICNGCVYAPSAL